MGGWAAGQPKGNGYFVPYKNPRLEDGPKGEYLTDRLTDEAIQFLQDVKDANEEGLSKSIFTSPLYSHSHGSLVSFCVLISLRESSSFFVVYVVLPSPCSFFCKAKVH